MAAAAPAPAAPDLIRFDGVDLHREGTRRLVSEPANHIARLRIVLDEAGTTAPIHLSEAPDPLLTPLHFRRRGRDPDRLS